MLCKFRITIYYALTLGLAAGSSYSQTLPAFTVRTGVSTPNATLTLAENLFGPDSYNLTEYDNRYIVLSFDGTKRVEFDILSGGIWATDKSALWNSEAPVPDLPNNSDAIALADALVKKLDLLPLQEDYVKVSSGRISGTFLAHECESTDGSGYERQQYPLDVSVNYDISISLSGNKFLMVGGGGKFQVTYGMCGKLIAFHALWREIVEPISFNLTPEDVANEQFLASTGYLNDSIQYKTTIAFYSEPFGRFQSTIYPVYVHTATSDVQNEPVMHRSQALRNPVYTEPQPPAPPPPPPPKKRKLTKRDPHYTRSTEDSIYLAAAEWLGDKFGLTYGQNNTKGFTNNIGDAAPEWAIKYNRSNEDVWVSDFTTEVDTYANSVNILFYTGHATKDGWVANESGNTTITPGWVNYTAVENACDLLGQQNLDWLIIAACGPLQDEAFDPGAGSVFDRWRGIFNGLHAMFAYGSPSYDTDGEGVLFTRYAEEGNTLIYSWFRTAKEAQTSNVTVTAMWTDGPGGNALNDHLPGYGWVSEDNIGSSQCRWFMWSQC